MDRVLALFLNTIDFFLSPRNLVSVETRMRARMAIFTFLFWTILNAVLLFSAVFLSKFEIFSASFFLAANACAAYLIKRSFSPEKVCLSFSLLTASFQIMIVLYVKNWAPLISVTFLNIIYINCLIVRDSRKRFALLGAIVFATLLAAAILFKKESNAFWSYSVTNPTILIYLILSLFNYFVSFSMVSKIKTLAQKDLYLEVLWQERARRLDDASTVAKAMRNVLVGPVEAVKNRIEQLKKDPDQPTMDDLRIQLDELLLISKAVGSIHRAQTSEEALATSGTFMTELESLLKEQKLFSERYL